MDLDMPAGDRCTHRGRTSGETGPDPPAELRCLQAETAGETRNEMSTRHAWTEAVRSKN